MQAFNLGFDILFVQLMRLLVISAGVFSMLLCFCACAEAQALIGHDNLDREMIDLLRRPENVFVYSLGAREARRGEPSFFDRHLLKLVSLPKSTDRDLLGNLIVDGLGPGDVIFSDFRPTHGLSFLSRDKRFDLVFDAHHNSVHIYYPRGQYWNYGLIHDVGWQVRDILERALRSAPAATESDSVVEQLDPLPVQEFKPKGSGWKEDSKQRLQNKIKQKANQVLSKSQAVKIKDEKLFAQFCLDYWEWRDSFIFITKNSKGRVKWSADFSKLWIDNLSVSVPELVSWASDWLAQRKSKIDPIDLILSANQVFIQVRLDPGIVPDEAMIFTRLRSLNDASTPRFLEAIKLETEELNKIKQARIKQARD